MTDYKKIYDEVWLDDRYRRVNHGLKLWEERRELFPEKFETVIDIGCGMGWLVKQFLEEGYEAYGLDVSKNALPDHFKGQHPGEQVYIAESIVRFGSGGCEIENRYDLGVCCDVMEHIDEGDVIGALTNIWAMCNEVVFVIANYPSNFLGHNLHPTIKPDWWWGERMREVDPDSRVYVHQLERPGRAGAVFCIKWKRGRCADALL